MSEDKKKILASRTEERILDVLEYVCQDLPLAIPKSETRVDALKMAFKNACESFVGEFEDKLVESLYGRIDPEFTSSFCVSKAQMCSAAQQKEEL